MVNKGAFVQSVVFVEVVKKPADTMGHDNGLINDLEKLNTFVLGQVLQLAKDLPLLVFREVLDKASKKGLQQLQLRYPQALLLVVEKGQVFVWYEGMKVSPSWHGLQKRVVSAGRKSELLLQASKLGRGMRVVDATAGFGHDGLLLASTGAEVVMLEQNAVLALLLRLEQVRMAQNPNWQGLMARLRIEFIRAEEYFFRLSQGQKDKDRAVDMVYLDPMFPDDSFVDVKVGKNMQFLHRLVCPPSEAEEKDLLALARSVVRQGGRVLVKRPCFAPVFAGVSADECWQNEVIRFDGYFC